MRAGGTRPLQPPHPRWVGVEAVINKDWCGAMLAVELDFDGLIILTDGWGHISEFWQALRLRDEGSLLFLPPFYFTRSLAPPIDLFLPRE